MKKKIAIITGASGGIGREFTKLMLNEKVDEIWAIARNAAKLEALRKKYGKKIIPISWDLTDFEELHTFETMLKTQNPEVVYLINNAGIGKKGSYQEYSAKDIDDILSINCRAVAVLCSVCIPYMQAGSRILNISSSSSFQPLPYLNLYAATKAFVRSYSRALNVELKEKKITVTTVCPGWVDTELLPKEINGVPAKYMGMVSAKRAAETALRDAKKGRAMSVCSLLVKCQHVFTKLFPQRLTMKIWLSGIKKYR